MEGVPHLSAHDLRADLEEVYRSKRHHHLFAYFGTGDEGLLKLANAGELQVVPVRSELELRARLPALHDDDTRIAFLVPWTHDIPLDLAGRFALGGRVRRIGKEARLRQLFGAAEVDERALRSPLADHLLEGGAERRYPLGGGRLTVEAMWDAWLAAQWAVPTAGGLALDTLLGFAASDRRGPKVAEQLPETLREALEAHLRACLGAAGPVVWRAWLEARGEQVLQLALLFEVLAESPHAEARVWVRERTREALDVRDADPLEVARALGREAAGALRHVERTTSGTDARVLARSADELVRDDEVRALLRESTRLPGAWTARLDALGEALARGAAEPSESTLAEATRALRALEGHVFFKDAEQSAHLLRAEMAVRLLAWLVARTDRRVEPSPTSHGEAEALGRWYAEEGGYVDWARRLARDATGGSLGRGASAVVKAADVVRADLDRRFARSLVAWCEAGQPSTQVLPIQDVLSRVVTRFLDESPNRKLLVLLLDGMAWAQTVELLESLGNHAAPWGPLAWHATKAGRVGESLHPVVFAALPTITEVSRTSFFAGKLPKSGTRLDTSKDADAWASSIVKKYAQGTDVPRLLLRSESHTKGGGASQEALTLVANDERRVVAMVLNAIDDSLKASHATRIRWRSDAIASLPEILDAAREHGRAVLLASDHGHVPADRFEKVSQPHPGAGASGGGARWRPLDGRHAPVAENEVAFFGAHVHLPKGAEGIALLADDASVYAGNTHAGEHGGATLAEVVAPCLLVGCEENATLTNDPALAVRAAFVPRWWHFDVREASVEVAPEPSPEPKKKPEDRQLGLPAIAPPKPKPRSVPPRRSAPPSAFAASEVLAAHVPNPQRRQEVVRAVDLLLARQGMMSESAFGAELGVLAFRVRGYVTTLTEVLNLDGYEVVRFDPSARQVYLDVEKLAQLFEVKL